LSHGDIIRTSNLTNVPAMLAHPGTWPNLTRRFDMVIVTEKRCTKCGKIKPLEQFIVDKRRKYGRGSHCLKCHKEISIAWQKKNPEHYHEYNRQYVAEHAKQVYANLVRWRKNNPDKLHAQSRDWYRRNAPVLVMRCINRQKRIKNGDQISVEDWKNIKSFYGNKCLCCGRTSVKLEIDHVIPLSLGGTHSIDNIQPLCRSCNARKNAKHIDYRKE
jgi:5-methylcytosine-specific restriction endonuclease McrA